MPKDSEAHLSDEDLAELIVAGHKDALSILYDKYSTMLFTLSLRILNNKLDAEDAVQDVFLRIWERSSKYDRSRGSYQSWIIMLTRNLCIDRLRSKSGKQQQMTVDLDMDVMMLTPAEHRTSKDVFVKERIEWVRSRIDELSSEQKQCLELAFYEGYSHSEISEMLNEPLGTIKARIRRGIQKLKGIASHLC